MIAAQEELVARARATAGLSDLGPDGWQDGLERLARAARSDLALDEASTARLEAIIVGRLVNRLHIEEWYRRHTGELPPVEGPVVIHGLPRTGTTALAHLLAVSPHFRFQRRWEISDPVPPPDVGAEADDPRRVAAVREAEAAAPHASVQHISAVDGPFDDSIILGLDFHNQELALPIPSYTRWWRTSDFASTCAYHERVLRMLHSRRPPYRWLVKAPYHNFHLDELAARYPHARFLMTHRDPVAAFPSTCSTVATSRWALPGQTADPVALGEFLLEHLVEGIRRAMAARETVGEGRFLDVTQQELEEDAVGTARRIHDFLGLELDGPTRHAMGSWAASNRRGVRGEHRYAPEDYGMTAADIRRAFAPYIEAFDVQPEPR